MLNHAIQSRGNGGILPVGACFAGGWLICLLLFLSRLCLDERDEPIGYHRVLGNVFNYNSQLSIHQLFQQIDYFLKSSLIVE